jgi:hypothetical protein
MAIPIFGHSIPIFGHSIPIFGHIIPLFDQLLYQLVFLSNNFICGYRLNLRHNWHMSNCGHLRHMSNCGHRTGLLHETRGSRKGRPARVGMQTGSRPTVGFDDRRRRPKGGAGRVISRKFAKSAADLGPGQFKTLDRAVIHYNLTVGQNLGLALSSSLLHCGVKEKDNCKRRGTRDSGTTHH